MGGTIAGRSAVVGDNVSYRAGEVSVSDLVADIPTLSQALGPISLEVEQVAQINSKDLCDAHWLALASRVAHHLTRSDVDSVLITHGTDTLEESAYFLSAALPAELLSSKPVVFTCAMRPASALSPDGPQNILDAVAVARAPGACGVIVVCAGTAHSAQHVQKIWPYQLNAFGSGDAGPLGYIEEGRLRRVQAWPSHPLQGSHDGLMQTHSFAEAVWPLPPLPWPRVELVVSHAGVTGSLIDALCNDAGAVEPLRGIVVAGTGNGSIHREMEEALRRAIALGVQVQRSTRCAFGAVVHSTVPSKDDFMATALSPAKARVQMVLNLMYR
jgi:L-asparaginase